MKEKLLGIICFVKQAKNIYDFRGFQTIRSFGEIIIIKNGVDELSKQTIKKTKIKKDKQKKKILLIVQ